MNTNFLRSAADAVVCKGGRFEEVIVSSREIAASSMQLVMASRVKADPSSAALGNLNAAAKTISGLTGNLVATAESCRDRVSQGKKQRLAEWHTESCRGTGLAL